MPGELTRMESKWRIDGEFWNMRIEKKGTKFSLELYSGFILFLVYLFIYFIFILILFNNSIV